MLDVRFIGTILSVRLESTGKIIPARHKAGGNLNLINLCAYTALFAVIFGIGPVRIEQIGADAVVLQIEVRVESPFDVNGVQEHD